MSNEEANELWDEIGKRATVRSNAAAKVVREGTNIRLKIEVGGDELLLLFAYAGYSLSDASADCIRKRNFTWYLNLREEKEKT